MSNVTVSTSEEIEALIVAFMQREIVETNGQDVDVEENLFTSGLVDSVGFMRLVGHVSEALAVTVPPAELVPDNFRTIRTMARYLQSLL